MIFKGVKKKGVKNAIKNSHDEKIHFSSLHKKTSAQDNTWWHNVQKHMPILRDRYVKTPKGYWRMRFTLPMIVLGALVSAPIFNQLNTVAASLGSHGALVFSSVLDNKYATVERLAQANLNIVSIPSVEASLPKKPYLQKASYRIERGDTLSTVLERADIGTQERMKIADELKKAGFDPRGLRVGQDLSIEAMVNPDGQKIFKGIEFKVDPFKHYQVASASGNMIAKAIETPMRDIKVAHALPIRGSVYESMRQAGVPKKLVGNFLKPFGHFVDFQRDIRSGQNNSIEVLYNARQTVDGEATIPGDIVYAALQLGDKRVALYRYETSDGSEAFYTEDGKSGKRLLMRTPISGARISSGYGMRKHPVLGYSKMHKGVDFAAPTGTPIYAAGDGVVERAGRFSSYGHYIRIRHANGYKTAYAHLNGYAKGMRAGKRVKQGDVIGYVGSTGRSTGPHLHYEVLKNDRHVNPSTLKMSGGIELAGAEKDRFKAEVARIKRQFEITQRENNANLLQEVRH